MTDTPAPSPDSAFPGEFLSTAGLNRQHVFELADLPAPLRAPLASRPGERQLILLGHAGPLLWSRVQASGLGGEHPIDDYCLRTVDQWFEQFLPTARYRLVYPGDLPVGLQALGSLAGWHHASPFMVGVDREWGSWFAYRAVVITDTRFAPSARRELSSPCLDCVDRPCIAACPAQAAGPTFNLAACSHERLKPTADCALGCRARNACPVGTEHRYPADQIRHSYAQSLSMLRDWLQAPPTGRTPPSASQPRTTR